MITELPAAPATRPFPALGFVRPESPRIGFAESVAHLMTKPAFARAPFGHIARILAGQVGRGHYALVKRGSTTVGFVGWALPTRRMPRHGSPAPAGFPTQRRGWATAP